jgi:hypothetical protein
MNGRRAALALTGTLLFAAGFWLGRERPAEALPPGRVFELRTYTANPGKLEALDARFRNHARRLFAKHGMRDVGYWRAADAPASADTLVYILAHRDRAAATRSWDAFRADPEWQKIRAETEANGKLLAKADVLFLDPTDYSPLM